MPNSSGPSPRHPSTARLRAAAVLVVVITGALSGTFPSAATTAHTGPAVVTADREVATAALTAARALADGVPGTSVVGPDVVDDLGYAPGLEQRLASRDTGDCSSPVPLPESFEPACRVHDLGYDLLRVGHRRGATIPGGLRADLDALLAQQMRDACGDRVACRAMARIATVAVHVNTVRQGHGAPVEEGLPW